ncbi:NAD(P)(+) transhydrogenase (Re/Si-specific) subunit beta [Oligoflexia bacterium]|nr:NAD(P)(+) transhydrogenase (Re/Si-specific) subunit beta [Oligoflexia bacterium]
MEHSKDFFALAYLVTTILFIFGLKGLASPKTALRGNMCAMLGMAFAVIITLFNPHVHTYRWIWAGLIIGGLIGTVVALKIQMTAMPQLVAAFHSFVGLSAVLIAAGMFMVHRTQGDLNPVLLVEIGVGSFIGAITFTGSVVAFGKLQGLVGSSPVTFKGQHLLNLVFFIAMVVCCVIFVQAESFPAFLGMSALAFLLGVTLIIPIGGADMPVVVSMLNSYSGWAAAATGFTLGNNLLVTTGALVGASGAILSYIMCKAMNRSFISVILGGFGGESDDADSTGAQAAQKGATISAVEDAAFMLENAQKVLVVPGYGMAVAQAQHSVKELFEVLGEKEVDVRFAIHPVAGRMPGHMNVLLAEADIPYDCVAELEEVNSEFAVADVAFIIGANDVVNPSAKTDKSSPLYGMPILDAYRAKQVFICKRSLNPGYAGVDNPLFYADNASLVLGDAKETVDKLVNALKE